jgi:hypothetical protein
MKHSTLSALTFSFITATGLLAQSQYPNKDQVTAIPDCLNPGYTVGPIVCPSCENNEEYVLNPKLLWYGIA